MVSFWSKKKIYNEYHRCKKSFDIGKTIQCYMFVLFIMIYKYQLVFLLESRDISVSISKIKLIYFYLILCNYTKERDKQ